MSEAVPMELVIAEMEVSEISEKDLESTFQRVVVAHKDAVMSIQSSMKDADDAYRKYLDPVYIPLEDVAKNDRATLNKAEKNIAEQYATLKEAYEKPLQNIEVNIKQIRKAIKEASGVVDVAVKKEEGKQKSKKLEEIQAYFNSKGFELVPLEKIFDQKWLNKGTKLHDIREEIDEAISAIYRDIEILEKQTEHGMAAKAFYLEHLDMGAALRQIEILKENAERLAREQIAREERKNQEHVDRNAAELKKEQREAAKEKMVDSMVDSALDLPQGTTETQKKDEIIEFTCTFRGTKEQLMKLREYMTANGIPYSKGLVLNNEDDARQIARSKNVSGRIYSFIYVPAA